MAIRLTLTRLMARLVPRERTHALIGLTVVFAVLLTVASCETVRAEHKRVAAATCFFAADASRVLQARSHAYLETAAEPIFASVGGTIASDVSVPDPEAMAAAAATVARCHCLSTLPAHTYFRFDVGGIEPKLGALVIARERMTGDDGIRSDTIGLRTAIGQLLVKVRTGAVVAVPVTRSGLEMDTLWMVAVVNARISPDGRLRAVYGLTMSPVDFATSVVGSVFDQVPLFAWLLSEDNRLTNRDLASLAVVDRWAKYGGRTLYQSGPLADTTGDAGCMGVAPVEPTLANLVLSIVPPTAVYSRWISQNMAASRLPLLSLLLIGLMVSGAAAAAAVSRQADLARLRSDFVASVSHEVRTPLAQIMLASEALSLGRTRSREEQEEAADTVVRETHRLVGLIDNVLQFSRIEHHNVQVRTEATDVRDLVSGFLDDVDSVVRGARVTVVNATPTGLTAMLDPGAFRQVLYNLVDNAIKYGPAGQRITIGANIHPTHPGSVQLWVQDEGWGVPADQVTKIFEPFVRLGRDRRSNVAGSGLGLAVVCNLVEAHGGRIRVEPGMGGRGSRFIVNVAPASAEGAGGDD